MQSARRSSGQPSASQEQVKAARAAIEQDKQQAMRSCSRRERLAVEIVRMVLRPVEAASRVGDQ